MLRTLTALAGNGLFWRAVAVVGLCLGIWTLGPLIGVGARQPLASAAARQAAIGATIAIWLLLRLVPGIRQARFQRNLRRQLQPLDSADAGDTAADVTLAQSVKGAMRTLKRHYFAGGGLKRPWLAGFSRQYLYAAPWYLVLGASGSGKYKALQSAGLDFSDPAHHPDGAARGSRPPNHCAWYFTPQGVLLCPSGCFLREGNTAWSTLLGLLRRHRSRQPINGVVLAVSACDLLHASRDEQYRQALSQRKRLHELRRRLGINFPIYVMITKADRLAGFSQFFSRFDGPELEQAWGMAFVLPSQPPHGFAPAYDRLQWRLNAALADTLLAEQDPHLRARSFVFPQAFAALRPTLLRYLDILFAPSQGDPNLWPRGVYFTSANQKNVRAPAAPPACQDSIFDYRFTPEKMPAANEDNPPAPQSYFLQSLFRDIIFAESGLAGTHYWRLYRRRLLVIAGCGALSVLLCLAGGYCITSYHNNRLYLAQVQTRLQALEQQSSAILRASGVGLPNLLPFLDDLRLLAGHDKFDVRHPPLDYRMGLYRGAMLTGSADAVYQHALKRILLPLVARQAATVLSLADFSEADNTYQALKAYQMLHEPRHYDGEFLLARVVMTLEHMPGAAGLDAAGREQLRRHLSRLIDGGPLRSPYPRDCRLVKAAQRAIQQQTLSQRVYHRLKQSLLKDGGFKSVSLVDLAGGAAEQELVRISGMPLTAAVPGLFTPQGYWLGFQQRLAGEIAGLRAEDRWVLNRDHPLAEDDVAGNVRQWYMNDFILRWDSFLSDIGLRPTLDLHQRINSVRVLSGERSPLRCLVVGISQVLSLPPPDMARGKLAHASRRLGEKTAGVLNSLFFPTGANDGGVSPEQTVRNHYRDIIDLARPQGDSIAFDPILQQLGALYRSLIALQNSADAAVASGDIVAGLRADAQRLPPPLRGLVLGLANGASQDTQRQAWLRLRRLFDTQLGDYCRLAIAGRYPLAPNGAIDLGPDDLARMFAPGQGLSDRFYQQHLADKVNTGAGRWHFFPWVQAGGKPGDDAMLQFFRAARYVGDAFFPPGALRPSFSFTLRPQTMDHGILSLTLDIDGQTLSYNHGSPADYRLSWPGPRQSGKARLTMMLAGGATRTIEKQGAWAFNRLLDCGKHQRVGDSMTWRITFTLDGHAATLELIPDSVRNPFTMPHFSCAAPAEPL
ncbi:type VI secretion system membrane subunit TssM [Sodalis sp. RH21]|uniref:type VI secretion system membrane subunit TssM n=1 Tax=unclassified Sodalis (in: enterobacteria) TaxID=2636512 RepID=UPI0039B4F452